MASAVGGITIENLSAFRAALKATDAALPRSLTKALKAAGAPPIARAKQLAPVRSGALAAGYKVSASGSTARLLNKVPYAAGAEWGRFGKWSGFQRYGGLGRFAWRALEEKADEMTDLIYRYLEDEVQLQGWARP